VRARVTALAAALLLFAACGEEAASNPRCATCGMIVAEDSGWRAGGEVDGEAVVFDAPKCLFRHQHERGAVSAPWVIEYYSQERRDAEGLLYVIGSDLESPMGRDLVPVEGREAAERLVEDHHGEAILGFDEVSEAIVTALFTPRG